VGLAPALALALALLVLPLPGTPGRLPAQEAPGAARNGEERPEAGGADEGRRVALADVIEAFAAVRKSRFLVDFTRRDEVVLQFVGDVDWPYEVRGEPVRLRADELRVAVRIGEKPAASEPGKANGAPREPREPRAPRAPRPEPPGAVEEASRYQVKDFTFYASGNVLLELPARGSSFVADELYYESRTTYAVARGARLRTSIRRAQDLDSVLSSRDIRLSGAGDAEPLRDPDGLLESSVLTVRTDVLRMYGFEFFSAEGIEVSTCDFGVPHYALSAAALGMHPVGEEPHDFRKPVAGPPARSRERSARSPARGSGPEREAGADLGPRDFIVDPEASWLEIGGQGVLPLPVSHWDTRWNDHFPVRSIDVGSSSKFGSFVDADWNLNYLLGLAPLSRFLPLDLAESERGGSARLGFETFYSEDRGFGWGPNAQYGLRPRRWEPWQLTLDGWSHYGEAQYFAIEDEGDEDRTTRMPPPERDRFWGHVWHQQSVPHVGIFNLEYSDLSDSAFLDEYFERIAEEEKEQENIIYWRRNFRDNVALAGLYQFRIDDFTSTTERLPEGKAFVFQEPVFQSGLYTDLAAQAARLRVRPDDALGLETSDYDRYDVLNEWAYPVGFHPWAQLRPFAFWRYTYYGDVVDPTLGAEDRFSLGAGVSVAQEWSRVFALQPGSLASRVFRSDDLKHVIVPELTYRNLFANNLDAEDTIDVDATDAVDKVESFTISFTNEVLGRRRLASPRREVAPRLGEKAGGLKSLEGGARLDEAAYRTDSLLESEVSFTLFPQPARDNTGDTSSLLTLDNTVRLVRDVTLRAWFQLDPNEDFHGERVAFAVLWDAIPDRLRLAVGDRFTRDRTQLVFTHARAEITDKWVVDAYYSHDFEDQRDQEIRFILSRIFHCFVLSIEYEQDVGEDRNTTVLFNFQPLEMFEAKARRDARW
jgi:hypothetical protein